MKKLQMFQKNSDRIVISANRNLCRQPVEYNHAKEIPTDTTTQDGKAGEIRTNRFGKVLKAEKENQNFSNRKRKANYSKKENYREDIY